MQKQDLNTKIATLILIMTAMLILGTIVFSVVEHWTLLDAFYFVTMTATTVGYGDFTPTHNLSKILTILYAISIIPLALYFFSAIAKYQVDAVYKKVHKLEKKQNEQEEEIELTEKQLKEANQDLEEQEKELLKQERSLKYHARLAKIAEEALEKLKKECHPKNDKSKTEAR